MWKWVLVNLLVWISLATSCMSQQKRQNFTEAGINTNGNIYVSSDSGQPINMTTARHCIEAIFAADRQTVGCSVARGTTPEESMQSIRLELYFRNGKLQVIETETPMDWHFWKGGRQVSVHSRSADGKDRYALYDAATTRLIQELPAPSDKTLLPEWAKNRAQLEDESVPEGEQYLQDRTQWIGKVLHQITEIQPGMKRQDLLKVFTTEGGLSTRYQRTYVYAGCPYIKVDVRFKIARKGDNGVEEEQDDTIESISQPYLAYSVMD
jgi:hypothetical protein